MLRGTLKGAAGDQTSTWAPYAPPVEELSAKDSWLERRVLKRSCADVLKEYNIPGREKLDCYKVWKKFKDVVVKEFKNQKILAVCRHV